MQKKYKVVISAVSIILLIFIGFAIFELSEISEFAGVYESVDAKDSVYELTLSGTGHLSIADIGAGNPAMEGWLYRLPFSKDNCYRIILGSETDNSFLKTDGKDSNIQIWPGTVSVYDNKTKMLKIAHTIVIENNSEHIQFEEKNVSRE